MAALRISLLRSDGPHHRHLEELLARNFELACVVEEPAREQIRRLRDRRKWGDWYWWQYHAARRRLLRLDRYRERFFAGEKVTGHPVRTYRTTRIRSINEDLVTQLLRQSRPDVTVVIGTSILKRRTLRAAGPVTINIHGGILPHYRGNHCVFFALYDGRPELAGSTIHFVDHGVDTGDIIERVPARAILQDSAEATYCRAEKRAFERIVELLKGYETGKPLPRQRQGAGGRTLRMRDRKPHHDVLFWLRRCRLKVVSRMGSKP